MTIDPLTYGVYFDSSSFAELRSVCSTQRYALILVQKMTRTVVAGG